MAKKFFIGNRKKPGSKTTPLKVKSRAGEVVVFEHEGDPVVGVIEKAVSDDRHRVEMVLPGTGRLLFKTGSFVILESGTLKSHDSLVVDARISRVKEWTGNAQIEDSKSATEVKDGDRIVDYTNVKISGFLSTFVGTTPEDRDGEYVMPDAFKNTLEQFRRNPVMLMDHRNSVDHLAGSFTKIGTNAQGLFVEGKVSDGPGLIDTRFKIAEGHLKTLSMGGLFRFNFDDPNAIETVDLFEGSLTPIPANPDAIFQSRSLTVVTAAKMMKRYFSIL